MIIQWTNKWSGEKGFVKKLNRKEEFFENTFERSEAMTVTDKTVTKTLELLNKWCDSNHYEVVKKNPEK